MRRLPSLPTSCAMVLAVVGLFGPARAQAPLDAVPVEDSDDPADDLDEDAPVLEMTVQGRSEGRELAESAQAVTVVDTKEAKRQSADMGDVLRRTQGVATRRSGGLGSQTRFSLNGLYDEQIRFFVDGVPLDVAGYGFDLANVPVNLVDRVEIYRGVVPIRLGADALGGAVNLVSDRRLRRTGGSVSLQVGSFSTLRATALARVFHENTGFTGSLSLFSDRTNNDYIVDVEIPDERGRLHRASVPRFHDGYAAYGVGVEVGFLDRAWADRVTLRLHHASYDKELQHNTVMTVPYGEVTYGQAVTGGTLRYELGDLAGSGFGVELTSSYARRLLRFRDDGAWIYDWRGQRLRERRVPGEIEAQPHDTLQWQDTTLSRLSLSQRLPFGQVLRASVAPTLTTRSGDERIEAMPGARDPLNAQRNVTTLVVGLEHELSLLDGLFESLTFGKGYTLLSTSEEHLPGNVFRKRERGDHFEGAGVSVRVRPLEWLYGKVSYEWATRLPGPYELFGDGVLILPNLGLEPERSHNANASLHVDVGESPAGSLRAETNAFLRESDQLIVLLGNDRLFQHQNVYAARSFGLEGAVGYTTPGGLFAIDANTTWMDLRNSSDDGAFQDFKGDRIPNRPWLFANLSWRVRHGSWLLHDDEATFFWASHYTHGFFRGWESQGLRQFKQSVPPQLTHTAGVSYAVRAPLDLATTLELQNLTDAKTYDVFGVQRPGRALFVKWVAEL